MGTYETYRGSYLAKLQGNERHAMAAMATDLMQGLLVTDVSAAVANETGSGNVRYSRDAAVRLTAESFGTDVETAEAALVAAERYEYGVD